MKKLLLAAICLTSLSSFAIELEDHEILMILSFGSTVAPFYSTSHPTESTGLITDPDSNRELLLAVRDDAVDYLGGETMTQKLSEVIESLRAKIPSYQNADDEEIASDLVAL